MLTLRKVQINKKIELFRKMKRVILILFASFISIIGLSAQKTRVDSIIIMQDDHRDMKTLIYKANNLLGSEIYHVWDNGTWRLSGSKWEYDYNSDKKLKTKVHYIWDKEKGKWVNKLKYEYEYNGNIMIERCFHYAVSYATGQPLLGWQENESDKRKYEYQYDTKGNLELVTYYYWPFRGNSWELLKKDKYEYDVKNRLISVTEWVENSMMNKTEFKYDKNDKLIEKIFPVGKIDYEYAKNGNTTIERHHSPSCCANHSGKCEKKH